MGVASIVLVPHDIVQLLAAVSIEIQLKSSGMDFFPIADHLSADPIVDPVGCLGCGGQCRQHAGEDGRLHDRLPFRSRPFAPPRAVKDRQRRPRNGVSPVGKWHAGPGAGLVQLRQRFVWRCNKERPAAVRFSGRCVAGLDGGSQDQGGRPVSQLSPERCCLGIERFCLPAPGFNGPPERGLRPSARGETSARPLPKQCRGLSFFSGLRRS